MDRYGNYYYQGSGLWRSLRDIDFEESEVWDVLRERKDQSLETSVTSPPSDQQGHRCAWAPRMVPQSSFGGSSSSGSSSGPQSIFAHQSAPVDIPKWSNVERHLGRLKSSKASKTGLWRDKDEDEDDDDDGDSNGHEDGKDDGNEDEDEDDGDGYGQRLPPHEYIATRLARSKISSFSVFEGVGRKLKGRDLSRVRNDVLTKTGFLESP